MDDDDPIIKEIPVYLSKRLSDNLYIFDFNLEGPHIEKEDLIKQCKFKPEHQEVLLEVSLDINNSNYDVGRGEQIVINCDGHEVSNKFEFNKAEGSYFKGNMMDKLVFKGTKGLNDVDNYAVAYLDEGELHISPLKGLIKLKPIFEYLDKTDKRTESKEMNAPSDEEEEAKQVTVKFARQENEKLKKAREKSFGYLSKKSAEEPWFDIDYINSSSDRIELERQKLFCSAKYEDISEICTNAPDYVKVLIPNENPEEVIYPHQIFNDSLKHKCTLSLIEQLKNLLLQAIIITFQHLIDIIGSSYNKEEILKAVQQVAVLVQGNWIVQSELIYSKDKNSQINGVQASHMARARDYLLYQFTQRTSISKSDICTGVKIPPEDVEEILEQFAKLNRNKDWELILPPDKSFLKRFVEVSQRQQNWWEAKYKQILHSLGSNNPPTQGRQRRKSHRDSSLSSDDINCSPNRKTSKKKVIKQEPKSE